MEFSWDPKKDLLNRKDHEGLGFESAKLVFNDPNLVLEEDRVDEYGEQRWHATGLANGVVLVVVHVYRKADDGKEIIRIISAREANSTECREYFR